ncbi:MAG TPA: Hsp33 family molecular chaperone HslO [Rhizomicrobium sp.]|jgi:molecular chaperone Hsp33|nr:Hsp33 family molecular chaperone HslO [Rhizomicrobium sp.]
MSVSEREYRRAPAADFVLPFDLPDAGLRGRLVRLDAASTRALEAHPLPEPAARVAAETCVLGTLLGSALKLDGRLTVQTKSAGPLDLVAADYYGAEPDRPAGIRSYARLDESRFAALGAGNPSFGTITGEGVVAITIEPKAGGQRYQGIVSLAQASIAASAEAYFAQSEQLPTSIRLAAAPVFEPGNPRLQWLAGGLMLQATPDGRVDTDDWERLASYVTTLEDMELIDISLAAETLLWRLFQEDEVRVHQAEAISFRCDCNAGRIATVLRAYPPAERDGLADEDGVVRARCEFCGLTHEITAADLATKN